MRLRYPSGSKANPPRRGKDYGYPHRNTPGRATESRPAARHSPIMFTLGFDNERQTALTLGVVSAALTFVLTAPTLLVAFL
jgi:hypothetical protein